MNKPDGSCGAGEDEYHVGNHADHKIVSLLWRVLDSLTDAVFLIDDENAHILACNKAASEIFGYKVDEMVGRSMALLYAHEGMYEELRAERPLSMACDSTVYTCRSMMKRKNGTVFPTEQRIQPLDDYRRRKQFCLGTFRDITKLENVMEALTRSEEKFSKAFSVAPVVVAISTAEEGTFLEGNKAFERFAGYHRTGIIGHTVTELGIWEDRRDRENIVRTLNTTGTVRNRECRFNSASGKKVTGIVSAELMDIDGQACILWVIVDITERKELENTLRQSEEKYRLLFSAVNDAILVHGLSPEGLTENYIDVNRAACIQLGYTPRELLEMRPDDIMDEQTLREMVSPLFPQQLKEHAPREGTHITKDGRKIPVEISNRLINIGDKPALLYTARDLTRTKEVEETLRKTEAELRHYAAHLEDTNTALNVLLSRRDEDRQAFEEKILVNVKELVSPCIDRLKMSRLSGEQANALKMLETNLNDIFSPFLQNLTKTFSNLTPTEIDVANFIKQGKTSKEIADLLHISKRTVDSHRNNIRDKLSLTNKKLNLRNCLRNIG